jgi:thiamine kinase-like enzyme
MQNVDFRKYGIFLLAGKYAFSFSKNQKANFKKAEFGRLFDGVVIDEKKTNIGTKYVVIPDWNNPRWFVPKNRKVINNIGKIIKPTSLKASIIWSIAKLANRFNVIDLIFHHYIYVNSSHDKLYLKSLNSENSFVIYTGAPGIYQKFTVQEMDNACKIISFSKFGINSYSKERIINERIALTFLIKNDFKSFHYPFVLDFYEVGSFTILTQSPAESSFKRMVLNFTIIHQKVLKEIDEKCFKTRKKTEVIESLLNEVNNIHNESDVIIIQKAKLNLLKAIELLKQRLKNELKFTFSHGDFTPWNIFSDGNKLFIFDWEMAEYRLQLWDYFNFIYHLNILSCNFSMSKIQSDLSKYKDWSISILGDENTYKSCHLFFLIEILVHYIQHHLIIKKFNSKNNIFDLITKFNMALEYQLDFSKQVIK